MFQFYFTLNFGLYLFSGIWVGKFAFEHWGFWPIFPGFFFGVLGFYVLYQLLFQALAWVDGFLARVFSIQDSGAYLVFVLVFLNPTHFIVVLFVTIGLWMK
jgi:hypothetical protein